MSFLIIPKKASVFLLEFDEEEVSKQRRDGGRNAIVFFSFFPFPIQIPLLFGVFLWLQFPPAKDTEVMVFLPSGAFKFILYFLPAEKKHLLPNISVESFWNCGCVRRYTASIFWCLCVYVMSCFGRLRVELKHEAFLEFGGMTAGVGSGKG